MSKEIENKLEQIRQLENEVAQDYVKIIKDIIIKHGEHKICG